MSDISFTKYPVIIIQFTPMGISDYFCCCFPACFVHETNTTGHDASLRAEFSYASYCQQCWKPLDENNHVAAHVLAYPLFPVNSCVALRTFKTTCKKCNNSHNAEASKTCSFCGCWLLRETHGYIFWPFCFQHDVEDSPC